MRKDNCTVHKGYIEVTDEVAWCFIWEGNSLYGLLRSVSWFDLVFAFLRMV